MGGAADLPQRSSSPLKRRASDLESEVPSSQKDDIDMISVPPSDPSEPMDAPTQSSRVRTHSVDMLRNDAGQHAAADDTKVEQEQEQDQNAADTDRTGHGIHTSNFLPLSLPLIIYRQKSLQLIPRSKPLRQ